VNHLHDERMTTGDESAVSTGFERPAAVGTGVAPFVMGRQSAPRLNINPGVTS